MSLRREKNADLERIFYDFMNYYKYKNMYQHNHDYNDNNHDNHNHNNNNNNNHNHDHHNNHDHNHDNNNNNHNNHDHNDHHNNNNHNNNNNNHNNDNHDHNDHNHGNNHNIGGSQKPTPIPFYFLPPYRTDEYTQEYTTDSRASKVMTPAKVCNTNETFPTVYTPNTNYTQDRDDKNAQTETMYYKALFTDLNKNLMPYVESVIKQNSYVGSPINDKYFDKESLAQLVSDILDKAKSNPELVAYITDLDPKVKALMKNIVEALLLGELFLVYRPNTKLNTDNMTSKESMYDMNTMGNMSNMPSIPNMTNTTSMGMSSQRYNNMYGDPKNSKPLDENMDMYLNDCPQPYISEEIIKPKTVSNPYRSDDMQSYSN